MLKTRLLHPQITAALARGGHSSNVLITDGNFPHWTRRGPNAEVVFLNLAPGIVGVSDVLQVLVSAVPIEAVAVMDYARSGPHGLSADPPIWDDFRRILTEVHCPAEFRRLERFAFYQAAQGPDVCLSIATGEQRIYANLLLTIGVVRSD
jgi:L-fucose mutarotase